MTHDRPAAATLTIDTDAGPTWPDVAVRFAGVLALDAIEATGGLNDGETAVIVVPHGALHTANLTPDELVSQVDRAITGAGLTITLVDDIARQLATITLSR